MEMVVGVLQKKNKEEEEEASSQSHSWWFQGHSSPKRSPWLQSTLSELEEKTTAMLKLIEEDADSFAQRAEMYYNKRPELINMVEDFYRTHRSLAERFDQLKLESKARLITPLSSPLASKYQSNKLAYVPVKTYDSYSDNAFESEISGESEVDDPEEEEEKTQVHKGMKDLEGDEVSGESEVDDPEEEEEEETQVDIGMETKGEEVSSGGGGGVVNKSEVIKQREEIERLKEENKKQKEQLIEKDEEKREVIRQLSLSMEILKENLNLSKSSVKESSSKKKNHFEFNKLKGLFSGKLFNTSSKSKTNLVAL